MVMVMEDTRARDPSCLTLRCDTRASRVISAADYIFGMSGYWLAVDG